MQELCYARTSKPTYIQKEKQRGATSMTHFKTRSAKIDKNSRFKQPGTIGIGKYLSEHAQEKICFVINTWTIIPRTVI